MQVNNPNDDIDDILQSIQEKAAKSKIGKKKKEQTNKKLEQMNETVQAIYDKNKGQKSDEIDIQKAQQDFTHYVSLLFLQKYVRMEQEETGEPANVIMDNVLNGFRTSMRSQLLQNQERNESKDNELFNSDVSDLLAIERNQIRNRRIKAIDEYIEIARNKYKFDEDEDDFTP